MEPSKNLNNEDPRKELKLKLIVIVFFMCLPLSYDILKYIGVFDDPWGRGLTNILLFIGTIFVVSLSPMLRVYCRSRRFIIAGFLLFALALFHLMGFNIIGGIFVKNCYQMQWYLYLVTPFTIALPIYSGLIQSNRVIEEQEREERFNALAGLNRSRIKTNIKSKTKITIQQAICVAVVATVFVDYFVFKITSAVF